MKNSSITPICDFVEEYERKATTRFHMPGHKGKERLGIERLDITEITGADVLHQAQGIIAQSQHNAKLNFKTGDTFYSTEGSSLCIKTMLAALVQIRTNEGCDSKVILAARNVHRSMIDGVALLDLDIEFIQGKQNHLCQQIISPEQVRNMLENAKTPYLAVYVTSPDYLGGICDIQGIAKVCREYHTPLVVDNAHGAYLEFLEPSMHPIHLGASMCCDSAHKTLPVLTGGAYLHISKEYMQHHSELEQIIPNYMAVFGSTSPSYVILQSLDLCNKYLQEEYREKLKICCQKVDRIKSRLLTNNIPVISSEPLKIVIDFGSVGIKGSTVSEELAQNQIEWEYLDDDYVVLMVTPDNPDLDFDRVLRWSEHSSLRESKKIEESELLPIEPLSRACSIREGLFGPSEIIQVELCLGRVCAQQMIACPPAIPIAVCGEIITENTIALCKRYGVDSLAVLVKK